MSNCKGELTFIPLAHQTLTAHQHWFPLLLLITICNSQVATED